MFRKMICENFMASLWWTVACCFLL